MAENSNIEWTDHTFNPWIGCTKVSPACDHCYAEVSTASRALGVSWGAGSPRKRTSDANWNIPLKWNKKAEKEGKRYRVFCASLADVFDNEVNPAWRMDLFSLIAKTPHLDWLLLTKRIGNVIPMCSADGLMFDQLPNVWLGITICNQAEADRDIPKLLNVPAQVRFLSIEPMLSKIDLQNYLDQGSLGIWKYGIDWVIVGGESGNKSRPMHPDWARSIRHQCKSAGVPFLFKQWGEWKPYCTHQKMVENNFHLPTQHHYLGVSMKGKTGRDIEDREKHSMHWVVNVGKKSAGRLLDGVTHDDYPGRTNG